MESILYQAMLNLERLLAQQQQQQQQQQQRQQPGDSSAARQQSESQSYPSQPEAVSTGFVQRPTAVSESSSTVESDNEQSIDETSTRRRSCTYVSFCLSCFGSVIGSMDLTCEIATRTARLFQRFTTSRLPSSYGYSNDELCGEVAPYVERPRLYFDCGMEVSQMVIFG